MRWQRYDEAYESLTNAMKAGNSRERMAFQDLRSIAAVESRKYDQALQDAYEVERALGTQTARTCHVIGVALLGLGIEPEKSERRMRRSLELRSHQHAPHHNLGVLYKHQGRLEEAEAELRTALTRFSYSSRLISPASSRDLRDFSCNFGSTGLRPRVRAQLMPITMPPMADAQKASMAQKPKLDVSI